MKLSGFTIIRNATRFDFPFFESLKSMLPLVDEYVVNVGISDDDTKAQLERFVASLPASDAKKFVLFDSVWPFDDPEKRKGGMILSEQTNLALDRCTGDWCMYLQADEVLHEQDLPVIHRDLESLGSDVNALVFRYVHFYATYDVIQTSRSAYRREIRAVRNKKGIRSTGDAQSFRNADGSKISSALSRARIFHYGWVRPQEVMRAKTGFMDTLYHAGASADLPATGENYLYKRFVGLTQFKETHPKVMLERIKSAHSFDFEKAPKVFHWKDSWKLLSGWIERATGWRPFEFRNYKLIKRL